MGMDQNIYVFSRGVLVQNVSMSGNDPTDQYVPSVFTEVFLQGILR